MMEIKFNDLIGHVGHKLILFSTVHSNVTTDIALICETCKGSNTSWYGQVISKTSRESGKEKWAELPPEYPCDNCGMSLHYHVVGPDGEPRIPGKCDGYWPG